MVVFFLVIWIESLSTSVQHSELGMDEPWKPLGRAAVFYFRTFYIHGYSDGYIFEDSFRSPFSLVLHFA